jgi:hypothetical protein
VTLLVRPRRLLCTRVCRCRLHAASGRSAPFVVHKDDIAERIAAIGCSICTSLPAITFASSGTNGPAALAKTATVHTYADKPPLLDSPQEGTYRQLEPYEV